MSGRRSPCPPEEVAALLVEALPRQALVLDVACGNGEALAALATASGDWRLWGLDLDPASLERAALACPKAALTWGKAEALPYADASCDGVLLECIFSLLDDEALAESSRVCRPHGLLLLNDLFSQDGRSYLIEAPSSRLRLRSREQLTALPQAQGFRLLRYVDYTQALGDFIAQLIFDGRACDCLDEAARQALSRYRPGYGLWLWEKDG